MSTPPTLLTELPGLSKQVYKLVPRVAVWSKHEAAEMGIEATTEGFGTVRFTFKVRVRWGRRPRW